MRHGHRYGLLLAMLAAALCLTAGAAPREKAGGKPARKAAEKDPAFAPVKDDPALPRVLLIGDSISIGYTVPVQKLLAGKANVHRAPTNCGPTTRGLEGLDRWLGDAHWDVIHFNFGLHDLKQVDGEHQVPLEAYEKNLRQIVARLKRTGAALVWCSTTPVPKGKTDPPRRPHDVVAYNAAARKVMEQNGIGIDDLYGFALPRLAEIQRKANVHFTREGSEALAGQVAAAIQEALKGRSHTPQ